MSNLLLNFGGKIFTKLWYFVALRTMMAVEVMIRLVINLETQLMKLNIPSTR